MPFPSSKRIVLAAALAALAAPAFTQDSAPDIALMVDLPQGVDWTLVNEQIVGQAYSREWIPAGQQREAADWLITNQKIPYDGGEEDADDFLEDVLYEALAEACTSAEHEDVERLRVDGLRGAAGRTMCARRRGEDFGAFSDQAVFIENGYLHVITSELRIQPMVVAGVVPFGRSGTESSRDARLDFMDREVRSHEFVREGIRIAD
jgi:hypothetical protein